MKLNLILDNPDQMLRDFVNVSQFGDHPGFNKGVLQTLDWVADAGEVSLLIDNGVLAYFPIGQIGEILRNWISKLAIDGHIIIKGIDVEEAARSLIFGKIDMKVFADLVYGDQNQPHQFKKFGVSTLDIIQFLEQAGLKIIRKIFEGHEFFVEAIRIK